MNPRADDETVRPNSLYSSIGNGVKEVEAMGEHVGEHHQAEGVNEVDDQEAITPMIARKPKGPSKADIDAHYPLHTDYREWCSHCVHGKGMSNQHRQDKSGLEPIGTTVSMDYLFMVPEEIDDTMDAVLLMYDANRRGIWTMSVDKKGPTPAAVKWVTDKLDEVGYAGKEITLKSDQEPAILDLKRDIAIKRQAETVMVESPVRESKSNGAVERSVKTWQGQFRTLRHQLEARLGEKIKKGTALMSWLVSFTSEVLSKYKVHTNGRTTYEMTTGHRCKMLVCGFGEKVHFKISTEKTRRNKMDTEWDVGYFVGLSPRTTEYLIATEMGIISCATMRRMPDEMAYDKKCLEIVKVGYRDYVCEGASSTNPRIRMALPMPKNYDPAPMSEPAVPRRMRIRPEDLQLHGYTIGCPGCEAVQTGSSIRRNHTEECRTRVESKVEDTDEGRHRIQKAKARLDEWTAEVTAPIVETPDMGGASSSGEAKVQEEIAMEVVEEEIVLEDGVKDSNDIRYQTPERAPPVKRFHIGTPDSDADMEDNGAKVRRMDTGAAAVDVGSTNFK